ncbi:response regulator [Ramlibacter humi]|uniref:Response regulator n=1 Tax=Ramlibacter humi TaxID=2530451 RepID=A0A4Z0BIP1_9BURK|nr:response regulator [Ramlibacter humi]TFY98303.1 response regulator [Ramlibacter humi]
MKILVADDNRDAADTLSMLLEIEGHDVTTVYDGRQAAQTGSAQAFDAAILDLAMPDMDGYTAGARLRAARPGLLLIAMSGHTQPQHVDRSRRAGFSYHLAKPVQPELVIGALRSAVEARTGGLATRSAGGLVPDTLVQLREGGPVMMLQALTGDVGHCSWFDGERHRHGSFLRDELVPVGQERRTWSAGESAETALPLAQ